MTSPCCASVFADLASEYARRLLETVLSRGNRPPRTYGFEYEFLPAKMMTPEDLNSVREWLSDEGFICEDGIHRREELVVTFEPGGQIEYVSPTFRADDAAPILSFLENIGDLNRRIAAATGIEYLGTDYLPGRGSAPLLLTSTRYASMHNRFASLGGRGPEMMKGTAAVHLHVAISSVEEIQKFYTLFCRLGSTRPLGMSTVRRLIWDSTDPCRCGLPEVEGSDAISILRGICRFALEAVEFSTGEPFCRIPGTGFQEFLAHLTTMFTDVRVNVKGGTLELRTMDSLPLDRFQQKWELFVAACESA